MYTMQATMSVEYGEGLASKSSSFLREEEREESERGMRSQTTATSHLPTPPVDPTTNTFIFLKRGSGLPPTPTDQSMGPPGVVAALTLSTPLFKIASASSISAAVVSAASETMPVAVCAAVVMVAWAASEASETAPVAAAAAACI